MLCFLCSFSCRCTNYCYCAPGRLVRVVSTPDVVLVDTGNRFPPLEQRAKSEPLMHTLDQPVQFKRFCSLREKRSEKLVEKGICMSPISIASSGDKRWRQRRAIRNRAKQRLESLLSSSSGSVALMDSDMPPLNLRDLPSEPSISTEPSAEPTVSPDILDMTRHGRYDNDDYDSTDSVESECETGKKSNSMEKSIDDEIERLKEYAKRLNDNMKNIEKLNLKVEPQDDIPNGWHNPVSYSYDLEQYMQVENLNPFADPFEEEDRRSRTEMWIETLSPQIADSDNEQETPELNNFVLPNNLDKVILSDSLKMQLPEVRVDECSENSLSSPAISQSYEVEQDKSSELFDKVEKGNIERIDSLQTEELASETTSFISSEMDKASLVKLNFQTNLDKALEGCEQIVDINDIERFWDYRYTPAPDSQNIEEGATSNPSRVMNSPNRLSDTETHSLRDHQKPRSPAPTVERVVLYYTSDKRPSLTPSPSPSILTASPELSERLPIQISNDESNQSFIFSSIQNNISPIVIVVDDGDSDQEILCETSKTSVNSGDNLNTTENTEENSISSDVKYKHLQSSERSSSVSSEDSIVVGRTDDLTPTLRAALFQLDDDSGTDSEEGHVVGLDGIELSFVPTPCNSGRPQMICRSTSIDEMILIENSIPTKALYNEQSFHLRQQSTAISKTHHESNIFNAGKSHIKVSSASRRRSKSLRKDINSYPRQTFKTSSLSPIRRVKKSTMQQTSIIIENTAESDDEIRADQEIELRLFDGRSIDDIESSSTEDLLAIDTRPNSSNRKSVSFSENINDIIEVPTHKKNKSKRDLSPVSSASRSILKKEDRHRDTLHKLMCHAAERLYKDLRMLIEERDRSNHAIGLVPSETTGLSVNTGIHQSQYRHKLLENKEALDRRIGEVWEKLKELPLDNTKSSFVHSVPDSTLLTLNVRRRIRMSVHQNDRKSLRSDHLELASDYATRLAQIRERMIRRDSEIKTEEDRSVEEILQRVSRALYGQ